MDQDTMVNVNLPGGWQLIGELHERDFPIEVAFWAKLSEEERWILYLATPWVDPMVDNDGSRESYKLIYSVLRGSPELGIDPFSIIVIGVEHTMAKTAAELVKPKVATGPFALANPKSYRGITRIGGRSLGGYFVDGAFIYPPWEPGINPV